MAPWSTGDAWPDLATARGGRRRCLRVHDSPDRAPYSSDASLYRVVPQAVARPRHADDIAAVLAVAPRAGVPLTMRGAGTSIAGNAVGPGIVVDTPGTSTGCSVDPEARTARSQPGVVHAALQRAAPRTGCASGRTRPRTPAAPSAG